MTADTVSPPDEWSDAMWPGVWIGLGVIAGIALTVVAVRASRDRDPITGEQLFQLGIVFCGTGVALATTVSATGLGLIALGVVYMGIGATRRKTSDS